MQNPKLNILFLASWYPSREHHTLGNFVQRHAFAVSAQHRVVVVSAHESPAPEMQVDRLGPLTEIRVYFKKKLPLLSYQKAMRQGIAHAEKNFGPFDLAHVHVTYPAGSLAIGTGLPYVVTEHFSGYHPSSGFKWGYGRRQITLRILNNALYLLPVSAHLGRAIKNFGAKTEVLPVSNVVDTDIFYPGQDKPERFTFLHISTLEERSKNITGILKGFQKLEEDGLDFILKIGGDGDLEELQQKIEKYGPSTKNTEVISQQTIEGIAQLMRQSHCLVMFSHFENQPCTILEALCSGLPVVSSDVGGIPEVLGDSNGFMVEAGNEDLFAETLNNMIVEYKNTFSPDRIAMAATAKYSYKSFQQKITEVYKKCF